MKFEIGQNVISHASSDGRYSAEVEGLIVDIHANFGIPGKTIYEVALTTGGYRFAYEDELELIEPILEITGPKLSRQEKTQIAIELLDYTNLFSTADYIEIFESLAESVTTPQQAEEKEVREIMLRHDNLNFPTRFEALIHVLVSNGTLTLKQVERALGSDNV